MIALKSRTVPAEDAVAESLQALAWLRTQGTERTYFKYCSTFDSTDGGNIGPVTEAFLDRHGRADHVGLPGLTRARPDHLPGPPVRRGPAAFGVLDAARTHSRR